MDVIPGISSQLFLFFSHNERRTQWEDPRLQIMGIHRTSDLPISALPSHGSFGQGGNSVTHTHGNLSGNYSFHNARHLNQSLDASNHHNLIEENAHHYSHSHSGPVNRLYHPSLHPHLQVKRSFDLVEPGNSNKVPVSLQGDPYLNEHARQASHDSGLGYPVTPFQGEPSIMDLEEGYDNSIPTGVHHHSIETNRVMLGGALSGEMDHHSTMDFDFSQPPVSGDGMLDQTHFFGGGAWV